jgi:hypothetical protein
MLTYISNEPLQGIPYIIWITVITFYLAGNLSTRRFIKTNFSTLRSNTNFYEPMFGILLSISLLLCFLIHGSIKKQELDRFDAARMIYWSETPHAINESLKYYQINFAELDRQLLNSPTKIINLYKTIPSSDLVNKILREYSVSDRFKTMFIPIMNYSNIIFLTLIIVFISTSFQFGVNTVGLSIPRFGVILILMFMSLAILFSLEFLAESLTLSKQFLTRQY